MSSPPGGERPDPSGVGPSSAWNQPVGDPGDPGDSGDPGHPRYADSPGTTGWPDGSGQPGGWPQPEPGGAVATPAADRPIRTYLWQSLVATLLCCLPTGIVAIVYATQTQTRLQTGNLAGAREASGRARRWCIISLIAFVVVLLVYVVAIVITVAIVSRNN
ncbi:Interferon-induced transmembrane protein [Frankia torreyi]|uniref:Interferon-induced transmembrane protein n=1 Tax=Frankia torreyi TaxID=1856 RepID=A0A0D8BD98_9ACTN|nr:MULTISPECIES: CD225/dispanin family protein [Frankia]KJE21939.1 Interferon-induced transmembrane protein [Frankia torreyi]KQM04063.1 Interferon-induced transmembrane protein [Frankia sp. CpI1-P]